MRLVILLHDLSVHTRNVLEPAVLTTEHFPTNKFNQYFLHAKYSCQCDTVEKVSALRVGGYGFKS